MTTRLLLVDDHEVFLEGLDTLLSKEPVVEVVGQAKNGREAVERALELQPDVVIMDLTLPELSGIEATRLIRSKLPETKVLCLSMHAEKQLATAAFDAGASGYVLKEQPLELLLEGLDAVIEGRKYLCRSLRELLLEDLLSGDEKPKSKKPLLTTREQEVLQHIAEGRSTQEIATLLQLSPKTIGAHREHIRDKLQINSVAGLTRYAIRHGLTTAERQPSD